MKMSKGFTALLVTAILASNLAMVVTAQEIGVEEVQTITVDIPMRAAASSSKTVSAKSSVGMFLEAGQSNWSNTVSADFSALPANARIRGISVAPGKPTAAGRGLILGSQLQIFSPDGLTKSLPWSPQTMSSNSAFFDDYAKGTWQFRFYGENISSYDYGSLFYQSMKMTITYVV